jgi:hypothetical protein
MYGSAYRSGAYEPESIQHQLPVQNRCRMRFRNFCRALDSTDMSKSGRLGQRHSEGNDEDADEARKEYYPSPESLRHCRCG